MLPRESRCNGLWRPLKSKGGNAFANPPRKSRRSALLLFFAVIFIWQAVPAIASTRGIILQTERFEYRER